MRDGPAKRRFGGGAFRVHVDPLFVKGRLGKIVDHFLIYSDPVGHTNFGADKGFVLRYRVLQG